MKLNTGMMLAGLMLSLTAHGASFDCAKASTDVEKLVCNYPAISKLDDELGKLYQDTLNKVSEAEKQRLMTEQKHWLKHTRNLCNDEPCLKLAYWARQAELATYFEPKPQLYKHEADKAVAIKQVLATAQLYPSEYILERDRQFCGQLFYDLKHMKGVHFVDPVMQTQSYEDPALDKWKRHCGKKLPLHFKIGCPRSSLQDVLDTLHKNKNSMDAPICLKEFGIPPLKIYELLPLKQRGKKRYFFYADGDYGLKLWRSSDLNTAEHWEAVKEGEVSGFQQFDPERCESAIDVYFLGGRESRDGNYNNIVKYRSQYYFMGLNKQLYTNSDRSAFAWILNARAVVPNGTKGEKSCRWSSALTPDSSTQGSK